MKPWTLVLSGSFAGAILLLALAAGWRVAPAPVAPRADADARWWNGTLTREFESHYDAVFPVRTLGINTWGAISYVLFREGKPGVVVGADGWLYTSEEFKLAADADAQVAAHLAQVAAIRERLAARGSALLIALVPAKARVEAATLGSRTPPALHAALYPRALESFRAQAIAAPDLAAALRDCKARGPVFLRTDTHWTPAGARCAADALATSARLAGFAGLPEPAYRTTAGAATPHRGDLMAFLPLDPWFARLLPPADVLEPQHTEPLAAPDSADTLLDDAPKPEVVLVGTSYSANPLWNFTGALQQALREDVVSYATPAHGPFQPMLEYLASADFQSAPPRLVIWEMPERYLPMRDGDGPSPPPNPGKST